MSPTSHRGTEPVGPTSTSLVIIDVRDTRLLAISVKNTDALQTLNVTLGLRAHLADDFAPAPVFDELTAIPALAQRSITLDCGTQMECEVVGVAGGAGLDAIVTIRPDGGRR